MKFSARLWAFIVFVGLCSTSLAYTAWSLHPRSDASSIRLNGLDGSLGEMWQSKTNPQANLFREDREFVDKGEEVKEAKETENVGTIKYRLASILKFDSQMKAVFVSNSTRLLLSEGDVVPNEGKIESIRENSVITISIQNESKKWELFPKGKNVESSNVKGEDAQAL